MAEASQPGLARATLRHGPNLTESGSPARDRDHWPGRGVMIMIPGNPGSGRRRPAEGPGRAARAH
jgi:hypothetical protein